MRVRHVAGCCCGACACNVIQYTPLPLRLTVEISEGINCDQSTSGSPDFDFCNDLNYSNFNGSYSYDPADPDDGSGDGQWLKIIAIPIERWQNGSQIATEIYKMKMRAEYGPPNNWAWEIRDSSDAVLVASDSSAVSQAPSDRLYEYNCSCPNGQQNIFDLRGQTSL